MDAQTAAALANSVAHLNFLYLVIGLVVVVGTFTVLAWLGERLIGLDLEGFVDEVERQASNGNVWPGIVAFIVSPLAILGLILWVGLR